MAKHAIKKEETLPDGAYVKCTGALDSQINELKNAYNNLFVAKEQAKSKAKVSSSTVNKAKKIKKDNPARAKTTIVKSADLN